MDQLSAIHARPLALSRQGHRFGTRFVTLFIIFDNFFDIGFMSYTAQVPVFAGSSSAFSSLSALMFLKAI